VFRYTLEGNWGLTIIVVNYATTTARATTYTLSTFARVFVIVTLVALVAVVAIPTEAVLANSIVANTRVIIVITITCFALVAIEGVILIATMTPIFVIYTISIISIHTTITTLTLSRTLFTP
jgi:hypothetical protein